ncbi:acyl-CoA dehydrogenase [Arthrobacter crystallopoietes]|uniref:acyl-CoA dehydrogenase n=1 Tax=Crystallibacter crystallopoietes TaxID=37928 RepID=UPI001F113172|nr:acyl-CoA dehydrogenase [Arthrobacter crystallopoietes]
MNNRHDHANRKKAVALSAAGLVLVAGATVTSLAAWTDTEWVFGGADGAQSVGTSSFEVEQNVTNDTTDPSLWVNRETAPGGQIDFSAEASSLTPGDTVYAFVRLRTEAKSDAGELTLNAAVPGDKSSIALFDALTYQAAVVPDSASCNETGLATPTQSLVAAGKGLTTGSGTATFKLDADGATLGAAGEKTVCFALTLPATHASGDALQGLSATPIWNFTASSL